MTKDVIELAREAGICTWVKKPPQETVDAWGRFAALVAARERERCAQACERRATYWNRDDARVQEDEYCAAAIRALNTEGEGNDRPST